MNQINVPMLAFIVEAFFSVLLKKKYEWLLQGGYSSRDYLTGHTGYLIDAQLRTEH